MLFSSKTKAKPDGLTPAPGRDGKAASADPKAAVQQPDTGKQPAGNDTLSPQEARLEDMSAIHQESLPARCLFRKRVTFPLRREPDVRFAVEVRVSGHSAPPTPDQTPPHPGATGSRDASGVLCVAGPNRFTKGGEACLTLTTPTPAAQTCPVASILKRRAVADRCGRGWRRSSSS